MELISVNIGGMRTQQKGDRLESTGIYKLPAFEPVEITRLGIEADFIADADHHGGADQAIYVYGLKDYAWWSGALQQEFLPGTFGDNLTISDLESARFNIGDRLRIGSALLEVTAPRIPCATLARRMGDPMFARKFRRAERPGLYCRVIQQGVVQTGDSVAVDYYRGATVGVLELFRDYYVRPKDEATLRRFLTAPIAARSRADIERDLLKLNAQP
jgi:MOSC domain-containing protein YiiM